MKRVEGWPERLTYVIDAHRRAPFMWGRFDCATLFADVVKAIAGVDPLAEYRPWRSERDAAEILLSAGYRSMEAFTADRFPAIAPARARRGDIGFARESLALSCPAIIVGSECVSRDERGWIMFPRALLKSAFSVG